MRNRRAKPSDWQRAGRIAAIGRRSPVRRQLRRALSLVVRALLKLHRLLRRSSHVGWFEYVPLPRTPTEHADLAGRAGWYLADLEIPVFLKGPSYGPPDAPWLEPRYVDRAADLGDGGEATPGTGPHHLLHRVTPSSLARVLASRAPVTVVDPDLFDAADAAGYGAVRGTHAAVSKPTGGAARVDALLRSAQEEQRTAMVVATGPSADELDLGRVRTYDVRITCNSAVRNISFLEALQPTFITFADPVFHFGPNRYSAAFREDVRRAVEVTDALLLVRATDAALLLHDLPEVAENLVPFSTALHGWNWPQSPGRPFELCPTDNILTMAMLPAAFATATEVHIAGSDGRAPGERYFWRHNTRLQYTNELMETVFAAHPGFFRDRAYRDYYHEHCRTLEALLTHAESCGKRVRAVTSSHIPALQRRGATPPETE